MGSVSTFTPQAVTMYEMSDVQYQAVYNVLSFALASMMATTMYLWFRSFAVAEKYRSAVLISGLVTFIAAYHYIISKCGVGLVIYQITYAKSMKEMSSLY